MLSRLVLATAICGVIGIFGTPARSEPTTSIVVGFTAGGTSDVIARVIAPSLGQKLNSNVIVENRPGATGQIGSLYVARAAPDGHTMLLSSQSSHAVAPNLYKSMQYDPIKDFTPISLTAWSPLVLLCNTALKVNSVEELIEYLRKHPGEVNYAAGGVGDGSHLAGLLFNYMAKVESTSVPFQGDGPALAAVLGGQLSYMFLSAPSAAAALANNNIKALAVTSKVRAKSFPDLPTIAEAALPGYEMVNWWGMYAPPKMSPDDVQKLNTALVDVLKSSEARGKLEKLGYEVTGSSSEELAAYLKSETKKWADVFQSAGLKAQ